MKYRIFSRIFLSLNILLISLLPFCNDYLLFPFTLKNPTIELNNNKLNASDYLKYIKYNQLATKIYMGTPPKEIEIYLSMQQYEFLLGKGFCLQNSNSQYNPSSSTSYEKNSYSSYSSPLVTNGSFSKESFTFYNNLNFTNNKTIKEVQFIHGIASPDLFDLIEPDLCCAYFGLQLSSNSDYFEWNSLIYELKMKNEIKSKKWSIVFYDNKNKINNYDGYLILGIKEEDYKDLFNVTDNDTDIATVYSLPYIYNKNNWEIQFDEIYYTINNQNISFNKYIQGLFLVDNDYIICNKDYFENITNNFFNKYINESICYIDKNQTVKRTKKTDIQKINVIICDKNKFKDRNKFPTLYFKHRNLNKIFELNYNEVFKEMGDYIIFSIVFDEEETSHWTFGRIFLKKYQFVFDNDQKTITYIKKNIINNTNDDNNDKNDNNDNNNKNDNYNNTNNNFKIWLIVILVVIIIMIGVFGIGLYIGLKIKKKKRRANELDDDYDYVFEVNNKKSEKESLYNEEIKNN